MTEKPVIDLVALDPLWQEFVDVVDAAQESYTSGSCRTPIKAFLQQFDSADQLAAALAVTIAKWCRGVSPARGGGITCGMCQYVLHVVGGICDDCLLRTGPDGSGWCNRVPDSLPHLNWYIDIYQGLYEECQEASDE